jgi:hypothetical protein
MRQQEVFAVRPGVDGALDAVRRVYADSIAEVENTVETLRETWEIVRREGWRVEDGLVEGETVAN